MHYASAAVLAIFEAMVDALLAKKGPAQNISKRGLYLGQRLPDGSRYGRYIIELPQTRQSVFVPHLVVT